MIVRKLEDIEGTDRDVAWGNGRSRRFLIKADGIPYSLTDTIVKAGTSSFLQYRNHVETCYWGAFATTSLARSILSSPGQCMHWIRTTPTT